MQVKGRPQDTRGGGKTWSNARCTQDRQKFKLPRPFLASKHYDSKWRDKEFEVLGKLSAQGCGVAAFYNSKEGNDWITRPGFASAGDHIKGLLLRANLFPCKETLAREWSEMDTKCRKCHVRRKPYRTSWGHVRPYMGQELQSTTLFANRLVDEARKKGWMSMQEQMFTDCSDKRKRPDIVLYKHVDRALIVDVTCRFESNGVGWKNAHAKKEAPYKSIVAEVGRVTCRSLCNYVWRKSISMLKLFTGDRWELRLEDEPSD